MFIAGFGVFCFGLVIGWISHRTLRLPTTSVLISDITTILEILGSAAIVALLRSDVLFGLYALGLILGFVVYLVAALQIYGRQEVLPWPTGKLPRFRTFSQQPAQQPVETTVSTNATSGPEDQQS
jgi:hypothetical protein